MVGWIGAAAAVGGIGRGAGISSGSDCFSLAFVLFVGSRVFGSVIIFFMVLADAVEL